jgi:hypothetical protein
MKNNKRQAFEFNEFEELALFEKKKHKKQNKRKWREIETLKMQHREQKEIAYYDNNYLM